MAKLSEMSLSVLRELATNQMREADRFRRLAAEMDELAKETLGAFHDRVNGEPVKEASDGK